MTSAAPYDAPAAAYDGSAYCQPLHDSQPLQEGDTVHCGDNPDDCKVIGTWSDWLWLLHPPQPRAVHGSRWHLQTREARGAAQLAVPVRPLRARRAQWRACNPETLRFTARDLPILSSRTTSKLSCWPWSRLAIPARSRVSGMRIPLLNAGLREATRPDQTGSAPARRNFFVTFGGALANGPSVRSKPAPR